MQIRKATLADIPFVEAQAYRLLEFGPPSWRSGDTIAMTQADINHIKSAMASTSGEKEVFIAEDEAGNRVGFLHLTMQTDYYTGEQHAHITDIVVIKSAEGTGVGRQLMQKADDWAREKNARWITLNVFEDNKHAQAQYEKRGFKKEWTKYLKEL